MGQNSLMSEGKRKKEILHSSPPTSIAVPSQALNNGQLRRQPPSSPTPLHPISQFYCWAQHHMVGNTPLPLQVSYPGSDLPSLLCSPSLFAESGGARTEWEKEKNLMLCKHGLSTAKTLVCYQHCFHHRIQSTAPCKNVNSIPDKSSRTTL